MSPARGSGTSCLFLCVLQTIWDISKHKKGQSKLAKGDIAEIIMTSGTTHSCLVDIFYRIRQLAARAAKLVLGCIWDPSFEGRGGLRDQRWYHSIQRR